MKQLKAHVVDRFGFDPDELDGVISWEVEDGWLVVLSRHSEYLEADHRSEPGQFGPGRWKHYFKAPGEDPGAAPDESPTDVAPLARPRARGSFAASPQQRMKVANQVCVACERPGVDPAHVTPRSRGGCDHRDCVVPLCRLCHDAYDQGRLDLLPHLGRRHNDEILHAVEHLGLMGALRQLTGKRWAPEATVEAA